ncbi:hypothetical protein [Aureibacter tunicatorum]|uniref:Uncharacterized protein n=1 Tax=Aureibacter tunicatorum TaxID=866807 RepID=A0AAE4BTQ8_9BACT|nr:hypothetical protein [Aureibacter tunicatorum]MDR6240956.1 hypothetical protein [Aureibacter tunicatorum]BDD03736.1 hypothetical protein AUTU_12190 [Aureibacter tunicatorum]
MIGKKTINITEGWKEKWNHFVDLEPDNNLPIDDIWFHFDEDILFYTHDEYFIDLGFYGGDYSVNRCGFFALYVGKGDFGQGVLYEYFISRSSEEIKIKIELYMNLISSNKIEGLEGLKYGDDIDIHDYIFSSVEDLKVPRENVDFEKISQANV